MRSTSRLSHAAIVQQIWRSSCFDRACVWNRCRLFLFPSMGLFFIYTSILIYNYLLLPEDLASIRNQRPYHSIPSSQGNFTARQMEVLRSPESRRIVLVHVGKTGGETLKHVLRVGCLVRSNALQKERCRRDFTAKYGRSNATVLEPLLSEAVTGYFHYRRITPPLATNNATHFLFTIRHPLTRIQSWFRYISPLNCFDETTTTTMTTATSNSRVGKRRKRTIRGVPLNCRVREAFKKNPASPEARFFSCFPTLEHMAMTIAHSRDPQKWNGAQKLNSPLHSTNCVKILQEILQSNYRDYWGPSESLMGHFVMNYHVSKCALSYHGKVVRRLTSCCYLAP